LDELRTLNIIQFMIIQKSSIKILIFILISTLSVDYVYSQEKKFAKDVIEHPKKYGEHFEQLFNLNEIGTYDTSFSAGRVILENGYTRSKIKNTKDWTPYRKNVVITQIDVVYTKYPINKEFWRTNYYELLARRIKELFDLDSTLNSTDFEWNIIL